MTITHLSPKIEAEGEIASLHYSLQPELSMVHTLNKNKHRIHDHENQLCAVDGETGSWSRVAGVENGPDELKDLHNFFHGRSVGGHMRGANEAELDDGQNLVLREGMQRDVHAGERAALLQQRPHMVAQNHHVVFHVLHRAPPRDELQKQHSESIDITLLSDPQARARELGRHVAERALELAAHHVAVQRRQQLRQAEVGDLHLVVVPEKNVGGF
jgi:hypothetical protein